MIAGFLEGLIKKFCGRYIKGFTSDNMVLTVGGVLNLTNLGECTNHIIHAHSIYNIAVCNCTLLYIPTLMSTMMHETLMDV